MESTASQPSSPANSRPAVTAVDTLRGLAILAVLLCHAHQVHLRDSSLSEALFGSGFLGVILFFLLSGFCIHHPQVGATALKTKPYLARRFFRIYPPYIVVVTVLFAVCAGIGKESGGPLNYVGHLFFWHYWGPASSEGMGITPVLWSVAIEVQFYLMYLLLFPMLRRWGVLRCAMVWFVVDALYYGIYFGVGNGGGLPQPLRPNRFAPTRFGEWLLGAALAEQLVRGRLGTRAVPWFLAAVLLITPSYVAAYHFRVMRDPAFDIPATLALGCLFQAALVGQWKSRILEWIGARCYSIYLVHLPIVGVMGTALNRISITAPFAHFCIAVGTALAAGAIFYRWIELPSHAFARRMGRSLESGAGV